MQPFAEKLKTPQDGMNFPDEPFSGQITFLV